MFLQSDLIKFPNKFLDFGTNAFEIIVFVFENAWFKLHGNILRIVFRNIRSSILVKFGTEQFFFFSILWCTCDNIWRLPTSFKSHHLIYDHAAWYVGNSQHVQGI